MEITENAFYNDTVHDNVCEYDSDVPDLVENFDDPIFLSYNVDVLVQYLNEGELEKAHQYFMNKLMYYGLTVDDLKIAIANGLDVHYNNDDIFIASCCLLDHSFALYLIQNHGIDINAQNSKALENAVRNIRYKTTEILLENGCNIPATDKIIEMALCAGSDYLDLLMKYGISSERMFKVFITGSYLNKHTKDKLVYFAKLQMDMDKLINDMVKN